MNGYPIIMICDATPAPVLYDPFRMDRSCLDLFSNDVGAAFIDINAFAAYVGGSPTNMSVDCRRFGLNSSLLMAFGEDPIGDVVAHFSDKDGVDIRFSPRKSGRHTSIVVLNIEPSEKVTLVFYRENCSDSALTIDDVLVSLVAQSRVFEFVGTILSRELVCSAILCAADTAKKSGVPVVFDLGFRLDQWHDPRAYGVAVRSSLCFVDLVLGTEDEINAALLAYPQSIRLTHSQITDARTAGNTDEHTRMLLEAGPGVVLEKRGKQGCRIHQHGTAPGEVP